MTTIVSFVNQKGGCAKSTTTVHFAVWLSTKQKKKVLLIDADAQRSSSTWIESMKTNIKTEVIQSAEVLFKEIPEIANSGKYDFVVIDGPAGLSEATRSIVLHTDVAIIPCQPSGVDIVSAGDALQVIKTFQAVRNGDPRAGIFLSRAIKGTRLKNEATALLSKAPGITMLKTVIHQRQVVADTFGQSQTVWGMKGATAVDAAAEYQKLFNEILALAKTANVATVPVAPVVSTTIAH